MFARYTCSWFGEQRDGGLLFAFSSTVYGIITVDITVLLILVGVIVVEILLSLIIRAAVELALSWDKLAYYTSQMRLDEGEERRKWRKTRRRLLHSIFAPSSFFAPLLHPIRTARGGHSHRHHRHYHRHGHGCSHEHSAGHGHDGDR